MAKKDKEETQWMEAGWNPATGCKAVSPGCDLCYAKVVAEHPIFGKNFPNGFELTTHESRLDQPKRWKKGVLVFTGGLTDLFQGEMPDEFIRSVWDTMLEADHHVYAVTTKRAGAMAAAIDRLGLELPGHIYIGVSVENQEWADKRMPVLAGIPAESRWVSVEPMLGPVNLEPWADAIKWAVVGGEGGRGYRPYDTAWARDIRDQIKPKGVLFYHKGGNSHKQNQNREIDGMIWARGPARTRQTWGRGRWPQPKSKERATAPSVPLRQDFRDSDPIAEGLDQVFDLRPLGFGEGLSKPGPAPFAAEDQAPDVASVLARRRRRPREGGDGDFLYHRHFCYPPRTYPPHGPICESLGLATTTSPQSTHSTSCRSPSGAWTRTRQRPQEWTPLASEHGESEATNRRRPLGSCGERAVAGKPL